MRGTGLTPSEFETEWRQSLRAKWFFVPDLNTLLWLLMVVLLLLAFVRRLRRRREEAEEEVESGVEYDDE